MNISLSVSTSTNTPTISSTVMSREWRLHLLDYGTCTRGEEDDFIFSFVFCHLHAHNADSRLTARTAAASKEMQVWFAQDRYTLYFAGGRSVESRRRKRIDAPLMSRKENHSRRNGSWQGRVTCNSRGIATYPSIISQLSRLSLIPSCSVTLSASGDWSVNLPCRSGNVSRLLKSIKLDNRGLMREIFRRQDCSHNELYWAQLARVTCPLPRVQSKVSRPRLKRRRGEKGNYFEFNLLLKTSEL